MNYEKIYNQIIQRAKDEARKKVKGGVYYEGHHIIPKCMGGTNDDNNLVYLTAKEHYMAHRLLCEIYPDNRNLQIAIWCMINGLSRSKKRYIPSGRIYAIIKEESIKKMSEAKLGKIRTPFSEEHKKRMSEAKIGKSRPPISEETRKKMSDSARRMSEETKRKMSESRTGKITSKETIQKIVNANLGKKRSEEIRKKMSIAAKNRWLDSRKKN
jgi:hypothetical protein